MGSSTTPEDAAFDRILGEARRIAVLGIKPESRADRPAHYVPRYMARNGYEIIPVPVYYPEVEKILDRPVYRRLQDIPGAIDMVNVFRRPDDLPPHVADIIASRPRVVWLQSGISHAAVERELAAAGIEVIADRCLMVEHGRFVERRP